MASPESESGWRQAGELGDLGLRFALFLALAVWGGWQLDKRWGLTPWLTLAGTAVGLGVGGYWAFLRLRDLTRQDGK